MPLLEFQHVSRVFAIAGRSEGRRVLDAVDYRQEEGEIVALIGPSGTGKTTMLALASGLAKPSGGKVLFDGVPLSGMSNKRISRLRRHELGLVFQNNLSLSALPAWENVALPLLLEGHGRHEARERAATLMEMMELGLFLDAPTSALSGGQRRRLGLARAIGQRPRLLLADEPTADLDDATARRIEMRLFGYFKETRCAALIVTHDPRIEQAAHRVIRLIDGKLKEVEASSFVG